LGNGYELKLIQERKHAKQLAPWHTWPQVLVVTIEMYVTNIVAGGHLPIDLRQDCRSALLGSHNSLVGYRRHKIAIVVTRFELNSPNATSKKLVLSSHSLKKYWETYTCSGLTFLTLSLS
jgi:hypothetical protein